ncbi:TetR/AcrR family transcriptional regulator [Shewanella violacea]|uniref:Transcriptional regulator, TetR family n=1 Tax=Shewanella violacea (strain JCM 10179 / CIP 106290 / LMG 19151 / DSS12) TaxID=637905 RepID=D4ZJ41_SHEVD|nr:TetR/AcrR family transcriptional regulator [Shewanella violacea]BAJ01690.1 transcriptional regulator, TetR family [Shewanella violacea DSS12]
MSKKRQLLIDTALDLFYMYGINSIGINEILKVSGVAKKTLYSHFESKDALILAALEQRHLIFIDWLEDKLQRANTDEDLVSRLFIALEAWIANTDPKLGSFRGCFFINTSAEFSEPSSDISLYCRDHKRQVHQVITKFMPNSDPLFIDAVCIMQEGVITAAYVANDHTAAKKSIEILKKLRQSF